MNPTVDETDVGGDPEELTPDTVESAPEEGGEVGDVSYADDETHAQDQEYTDMEEVIDNITSFPSLRRSSRIPRTPERFDAMLVTQPLLGWADHPISMSEVMSGTYSDDWKK